MTDKDTSNRERANGETSEDGMLDPMESLIAELRRFRDERNWRKFHTPKNLAASISIEAGELLELFQWRGESHHIDPEEKRKIAKEASDVLIYTLLLFDTLGLNPTKEAMQKIEQNARRYPSEERYDSPEALARVRTARREVG